MSPNSGYYHYYIIAKCTSNKAWGIPPDDSTDWLLGFIFEWKI